METTKELVNALRASGITESYINIILAQVEKEKTEAKEVVRKQVLALFNYKETLGFNAEYLQTQIKKLAL
mgnify:CR=1 FL=1